MDPKDCSAKVDDLTEAQIKTLEDWERKFQEKYAQVGKVKSLHITFQLLGNHTNVYKNCKAQGCRQQLHPLGLKMLRYS
jgi:hypothetical protein